MARGNPYHDARGKFTTASGGPHAARRAKQIEDNARVEITVLPGKTFRGAHHYQEVRYSASPNLAAHAVETGVAKYTGRK